MECFFEVSGKVFSALFTLECLAKLVALGFFFGRHSYLADSFNYLDLFIVVLVSLPPPCLCFCAFNSSSCLHLHMRTTPQRLQL